jgi:acyl carrier protein
MGIKERVVKIISDQLGVREDHIRMDSQIIDELGADSMDCVDMQIAVEEEFSIEVPDDFAEDMTTVQKIVDFVEGAAAQKK